jgi:hypothetical protein
MNKIELNTERMLGYGSYNDVNYLYGLDDLCKKYIKKTDTILELGTNDGISSALFSFYAKRVYTIDLKKPSERLKKVLNEHKNIEFINGSFYEEINKLKMNFEFIYIDGNHDYKSVVSDIKFCMPFLKNKIIGGHDFYNENCDVANAVVYCFPGKEIIRFGDSSWVVEI